MLLTKHQGEPSVFVEFSPADLVMLGMAANDASGTYASGGFQKEAARMLAMSSALLRLSEHGRGLSGGIRFNDHYPDWVKNFDPDFIATVKRYVPSEI